MALSFAIGFVSAGWTVPAYLGIADNFGGLEDWLFSIRTNGSVYKFSRLIDAHIELTAGMFWLGLVVFGWAAYGAARAMRTRELPNSSLQPAGRFASRG
jgi:hypothetical protein